MSRVSSSQQQDGPLRRRGNQDTPSSGRSLANLVGRLLLPAFFSTFAVAFLISTRDLGAVTANYPRLVIALLLVLLLADIVIEAMNWSSSGGLHGSLREFFAELWQEWRKAVYSIVLLALFIFTIPQLGFWTAAMPFLALLIYALGERRWLVVAVTIVTFFVVSYVLFESVLQVPLPDGILG